MRRGEARSYRAEPCNRDSYLCSVNTAVYLYCISSYVGSLIMLMAKLKQCCLETQLLWTGTNNISMLQGTGNSSEDNSTSIGRCKQLRLLS